MEKEYGVFESGKCINEYNGFQLEMFYMECAEKYLKKHPKYRDLLYCQLTGKYMEENNLTVFKIN